MKPSAFAATDVGLLRARNEDSLYKGRTLFAVADGLGGHQAGDVASSTAVEALSELDGTSFDGDEAVRQALAEAFAAANEAVIAKASDNPAYWAMGTTLTAALVRGDQVQLAHVGDSRAYLRREGEPLRQLTEDQTVVAELVREGRLTRAQAAAHPQRSILTQAIGLEPDLAVELPPPLTLRAGDDLLLCSDGLTEAIDEERIAQLLGDHADGDEACAALIEAANAAGGPDNVTVVLLRAGPEEA